MAGNQWGVGGEEREWEGGVYKLLDVREAIMIIVH